MAVVGTQDFAPGVLAVTVDADPRTTAVDAPRGSQIIFKPGAGIPEYFTKNDDGSTTNVTKIAGVREIFAPPTSGTSGLGNSGTYPTGLLAVANFAFVAMRAPDDFGTLVAAEVVIIEFSTGNNVTVDASFAANGQAATTHSETITVAIPTGANIIREADISALFTAPGAVLAAGDYIGMRCSSNFIESLLGIRLKYLPR